MSDGGSPPDDIWDESLAARLPGKLVLVGVTYVDPSGATVETKQCFGRASLVDRVRGITLDLEGSLAGQTFQLPPDTRSCQEASPGEYRLRSTGEVVVNPDFTSSWVVEQPSG